MCVRIWRGVSPVGDKITWTIGGRSVFVAATLAEFLASAGMALHGKMKNEAFVNTGRRIGSNLTYACFP